MGQEQGSVSGSPSGSVSGSPSGSVSDDRQAQSRMTVRTSVGLSVAVMHSVGLSVAVMHSVGLSIHERVGYGSKDVSFWFYGALKFL